MVSPQDLESIQSALPEDCAKEVYRAEQSGHAVAVDHGRREVYRRTVEFLTKIDSEEDLVF